MKVNCLRLLLSGICAIALVMSASPASAVKLFDENDPIVAVDIDPNSNSPGAEGPENAVDQFFNAGPPLETTKYLNFGKEQTGFIVTPAFGSSIVQSFQLRAANDSPSRDPLTYELYGTNDAIMSTNHSLGDQETWTLISSGMTGLGTDPGRHMLGVIEEIAGNATAYDSYKMVFPTIRDTNALDADSMQVADVQLFTGAGGGGSAVLADGDFAIAVTHDAISSMSNYPSGEAPSFSLDSTIDTKYLNFGEENSGYIVSRADGAPTIVESLTFTTAGDAPDRDPLTWELYGTNDPVTSTDNSLGAQENWTLVDSGDTGFAVDPGRQMTAAAQPVEGSTPYNAYRLVFPTLRDAGSANSMQVDEVLFDGQIVPEPSSLAIVGLALAGAAWGCRRRR